MTNAAEFDPTRATSNDAHELMRGWRDGGEGKLAPDGATAAYMWAWHEAQPEYRADEAFSELAAECRKWKARARTAEELLTECRAEIKRLCDFAVDAPRIDFNEDRPLSWIAVSTERVGKMINRIDGALAAAERAAGVEPPCSEEPS